MRRPARLSFLLSRAPTLRLSTVFAQQSPLPAAERRRQTAEAAAAYESSEGESEWEEDDSLWEDEEEQPEQQPAEEGQQDTAEVQEPEDEQAADEQAAPAVGEPGLSTAAPAAAEDGADGATDESDGGCGEAAAEPAVLQQREEEDESSNTAALDGGDVAEAAEGAENVPPAAEEPQPRYDAITHAMLKVVAGQLREMEARFAALEKSLFFISYALGTKGELGFTVPPHTRRRLGYNPKAGRAASAALTAVALVDDRLALKAAAAAGHASQRR
ncbi:hypothetical protein COHA_004388 [Chlorella ohadii]|uniref:Uncharacterized protein n=1 Tax=Chlorella ohadii TaxID=2649997 RepID=A0AAD5DX03_9CHLO|nr:hypothetical protein COHA_004388 [Chlorella ohadii]